MKVKDETFERIYPGIRKDQKAFLKKEGKALKLKDGELVRFILDEYIKNKKK